MTDAEKVEVRKDAEERYLTYVFLRQSGQQHSHLRQDLQDSYTTGDNRYPKTRQEGLHLLDKYSKSAVTTPPTSEGSSFAQKGDGKAKGYDEKFWKNKKCYNCNKKGHPASHCEDAKEKGKGKDKKSDGDDDEKSVASSAKSVAKLNKDLKKMQKTLTEVHTQLQDIKEESDLSDSDEEEDSHFQVDCGQHALQFTQVDGMFEPAIAKLFKQAHKKGRKGDLDLRKVILLDNQSTMDLICNADMVVKIFKSKSTMHVRSNGGSMKVTQQAELKGYHKPVWFSKEAITNIIALKNIIQQYRVTYNSSDHAFVVHRESYGKRNMVFRMHSSGLHVWDPYGTTNDKGVTLVNTVCENMANFMKRQVKGAEAARKLYAKLAYPSEKDFKVIVKHNMIANCPVTVDDIEVAHKIWGKSLASLKGKMTCKKPQPVVARDFIKVPKELMSLHKDVYLTADLFFVNKIPFFLTHSRKIHFTAVNHLANRKAMSLFKAFMEIFTFYLRRGFWITVVSLDSKFEPIRAESCANG